LSLFGRSFPPFFSALISGIENLLVFFGRPFFLIHLRLPLTQIKERPNFFLRFLLFSSPYLGFDCQYCLQEIFSVFSPFSFGCPFRTKRRQPMKTLALFVFSPYTM